MFNDGSPLGKGSHFFYKYILLYKLKEVISTDRLQNLIDYYDINGQQLFDYAKKVIADSKLDMTPDDFITEWDCRLDDISAVDHSTAKITYKFDAVVLLNWLINEHFQFQIGDVVESKTLIYGDGETKRKIEQATAKRGTTEIPITDKNIDFWNRILASRLITIPYRSINQLIKTRE